VTNVGSSAWRSLPVLAGLALPDEFAIHSSENPLVPLAKPRVRLGCFHDRHPRPRLVLAVRDLTEQAGERVGLQVQHFLKRRDPLRLGGRLAKQPLGHRRLRHADCGGQSTLRQAVVRPGSLERPGKHLSLPCRRHRCGPPVGAPELPEQACLIG
jgi:hypothetical protein